tara:strand:- start:903 stop:1217 length:315 start_codon:yes stop_codon:yes gene_type:complete
MSKFNLNKAVQDKDNGVGLASKSDTYIYSYLKGVEDSSREIDSPYTNIGVDLAQNRQVRFTFNGDEWSNGRFNDFVANELSAYKVSLTESLTSKGWIRAIITLA